MFLYRCIRKWTTETIDKLWIGKPVLDKEKEVFYKLFLEKCWLEKEPFGYFHDGLFYTPRTYGEYESLLNTYVVRTLFGHIRSLTKMADKGMLINSKIPAENLLKQGKDIIKLLGISEEKINTYFDEEEEEEEEI